MKIKKLTLDKLLTQEVGLQEVKIERMGTLVALVGKNGSGKSRFLKLIEDNINSIITFENILEGNVSNLPNYFKQTLKKIEPYKELAIANFEKEKIATLLKSNPNDATLKTKNAEIVKTIVKIEKKLQPSQNIQNSQFNIGGLKKVAETPTQKMKKLFSDLKPNLEILQTKYINRVNYTQIIALQEVIDDTDVEANSFERLIESVSDQLEYNELGSIYKSSLKFLKKLPHQLASDWIDCLGDVEKFNKRKSFERYKSLKDIFEKIFDKTLEWEIKNVKRKVTDKGVESLQEGIWKINERTFKYSEFSDGEKTLFAFVLLFFLMSQNNNIRLKDSILIIDEPELHLHPDAEIELINRISEIIKDSGQLIIATHSLNILANINYDEVFMVKDGYIKHPSNTIQSEALSELMKIEDRVYKLTDFLNSISDWAYVNFMVECFTNPEVIEVSNADDPQIKSLKDIVKNANNNKKSLLLDFGAGQGRLYEQTMKDSLFMEKIDYSALEPNENFHTTLKAKGILNVYTSYEQIGKKTFDFIVLCNVLHEIEIDEWIPTINNIIEALKDNGFLIIIESRYLKKGEKIGSNGYLLLDEKELKILFDLESNPTTLNHKDLSNKTTCVLLEKSKIKPLTHDILIKTLNALEKNTFEKIIKLRSSKNENNNSNTKGRQSAFLSQLNINSRMALKQLTERSR